MVKESNLKKLEMVPRWKSDIVRRRED